ncbi:MAG: hypothetical protein J6A59_18935 [Lachnospiraceae bacterium]|nr:hypothetical protein [Lachnospiraceae bacterium]
MKLLFIATIVENKKIIGVRLLDCDAKKTQDVPIDNIKKVLSAPGNEEIVGNLRVINGELYGTNGRIDRYAAINRQGVPVGQKSPLVIINKIGEDGVGYTVADFKGTIKKFRAEDVIKYANELGIANGKVCTQDNVEYISAIQGNYDIEKVAQSKIKGSSLGPGISIPMNLKDTSSVAKHASQDIETNINYNDVFLAMTPDQKKVLKQYYTWYTVEVYKTLAKSTRLSLAPGKAEKLAELRGIKNWKFGGVWDTGFHGGSKCELGHSLRYEYYAVPEDEAERIKMNLSDKKSHAMMGSRRHDVLGDDDTFKIIFGETCASDFFNIEPDQMKKLVKTREIMSNEIKLMADILSNGLEKEYTDKCKLLYEVLARLDNRKNIIDVFGLQVGSTLLNFIATSMPFPMSLVIEAGKQIRQDKIKAFGKIFNTELIKNAYENNEYYFRSCQRLFDYVADFAIEGDYMYDPFDEDRKRKDVGRYNKETRYARQVLLRGLRTGCRIGDKITIQVLDDYIYSLSTLIETKKTIIKKLSQDSTIKEFISSEHGLKHYIESLSEQIENEGDIKLLNLGFSSLDLDSTNLYFPKKLTVLFKNSGRSYAGYANYYPNIGDCASVLHSVLDGNTIDNIVDNLLQKVKDAENKKRKDKEDAEKLLNKTLDDKVPSVNYLTVKVNKDKVLLMANKDEGIQIYRHNRGAEYNDITLKTENYGDIKVSSIDKNSVVEIGKDTWEKRVSDLRLETKRAEEAKRAEETKRAEEAKSAKNSDDKSNQADKDEATKLIESMSESEYMTKLDELLDKVDKGELPSNYGTNVCKDIVKRRLEYDRLSYKQKWRVKTTLLELLKADLNNSNNKQDSDSKLIDNQVKQDNEENNTDENIAKAIKIIDNYNNNEEYRQLLSKEAPLSFRVALTVKSLGRCSEKQMKHLDRALELLNDGK